MHIHNTLMPSGDIDATESIDLLFLNQLGEGVPQASLSKGFQWVLSHHRRVTQLIQPLGPSHPELWIHYVS